MEYRIVITNFVRVFCVYFCEMGRQIFERLVTLLKCFYSEYKSGVSILQRLNHELNSEIHQHFVKYSIVDYSAKKLRKTYQVLFLFE